MRPSASIVPGQAPCCRACRDVTARRFIQRFHFGRLPGRNQTAAHAEVRALPRRPETECGSPARHGSTGVERRQVRPGDRRRQSESKPPCPAHHGDQRFRAHASGKLRPDRQGDCVIDAMDRVRSSSPRRRTTATGSGAALVVSSHFKTGATSCRAGRKPCRCLSPTRPKSQRPHRQPSSRQGRPAPPRPY